MNTTTNDSIFSSLGRRLGAGLMVMAVLAANLQAQYVSTALSTGLNDPSDATADGNGNIDITDTGSNCIVRFAPGTGAVTVLAGAASTVGGYRNAIGTQALFNQPQGIVYARGGLVVVDEFNQVLRFITLSNTAVSTLAGIYNTSGGGFVDGSTNVAQFSYPMGIAADNSGNLYIADWGNNAIRKLSAANVVSTLVPAYPFNSPAAVAVDNYTNIWVADSSHNQICLISNNTVQLIAGDGSLGSADSITALNAEFNLPSGLLWDNANNRLVISDTRNDTIRSLFLTNYQGVTGYAVQTLAGVAGMTGLVNGALGTSKFNLPLGLCIDTNDSGYYVADSGNNVLRVLQPTQPPPAPVAVTNPVIGYVTFPLVGSPAVPSAVFNPITGSGAVFNNAVVIAIEQNDSTVTTYFTEGPTGSVPLPTTSSPSPQVFTSADLGLLPSQVPGTQAAPLPDLTIYAFSAAPPRPASGIVSAEIKFVTANPNITANNTASSASVLFSDITTNAQIYYTLDGLAPTNGAPDTFGPVLTASTITFAITSNTTLSAQAIAPNFGPSQVVTALFSPTNVFADQLTFGFASGEGSSQFKTAPGQTFIAPVTLTLVPTGETIVSFQFNVAITNTIGSPPLAPNSFTFSSMLEEPIPNSNPVAYEAIPPAMFTNGGSGGGLSNLLFTNMDLLGVGWVERQGQSNLYNTLAQTLITYSQAHDTMFLSSGGEVIVGGFSFTVPATATTGQQYAIQLGSPSATSDGIATPVLIQTVGTGSMTNGPINSTKLVTVGTNQYLVGDVAPFYWFNAGDFGDGLLENNDVTETFQTAVYGFNGPDAATQRSDYFDAMDSSNGTTNNAYGPSNGNNDAVVNAILFGDGVIAVDDVYVTYRRSLDPSLLWVYRSDTAAGKTARTGPSGVPQPFIAPAAAPVPAGQPGSSGSHSITVAADQIQAGSGNLSVQVPIRVLAADSLPITVTMLRVEIDPLDGSPAISSAINFSANTNLGSYYASDSQAANDYAGVWLNTGSPGVSGAGIIGTLFVTLPANVTTNSAYRVHFDHFSASPNGVALFNATAQDGLITVGDRSGSSWRDGISDSWRLLWFGTVSNALSAANADPDGDGASNWAEYVAGTNPQNPASVFQCLPGSAFAPSGFTLQWPSVVNKTYSVQSSPTLTPGNWTTVASNLAGTGQIMQWTDATAAGNGGFYRAMVH